MAYVITDREKLQAIWEAAKAGDWPAVYAAPSMRSPIPTMPINLFRAWISRSILGLKAPMA